MLTIRDLQLTKRARDGARTIRDEFVAMLKESELGQKLLEQRRRYEREARRKLMEEVARERIALVAARPKHRKLMAEAEARVEAARAALREAQSNLNGAQAQEWRELVGIEHRLELLECEFRMTAPPEIDDLIAALHDLQGDWLSTAPGVMPQFVIKDDKYKNTVFPNHQRVTFSTASSQARALGTIASAIRRAEALKLEVVDDLPAELRKIEDEVRALNVVAERIECVG